MKEPLEFHLRNSSLLFCYLTQLSTIIEEFLIFSACFSQREFFGCSLNFSTRACTPNEKNISYLTRPGGSLPTVVYGCAN